MPAADQNGVAPASPCTTKCFATLGLTWNLILASLSADYASESHHGGFRHVSGYAREMERLVDLARLGGILPKTVTRQPRTGNRPWRTVETTAGMLNSIGLDNDGIDAFIVHHLPYLASLRTAIIVSIAGRTDDEFVRRRPARG